MPPANTRAVVLNWSFQDQYSSFTQMISSFEHITSYQNSTTTDTCSVPKGLWVKANHYIWVHIKSWDASQNIVFRLLVTQQKSNIKPTNKHGLPSVKHFRFSPLLLFFHLANVNHIDKKLPVDQLHLTQFVRVRFYLVWDSLSSEPTVTAASWLFQTRMERNLH